MHKLGQILEANIHTVYLYINFYFDAWIFDDVNCFMANQNRIALMKKEEKLSNQDAVYPYLSVLKNNHIFAYLRYCVCTGGRFARIFEDIFKMYTFWAHLSNSNISLYSSGKKK